MTTTTSLASVSISSNFYVVLATYFRPGCTPINHFLQQLDLTLPILQVCRPIVIIGLKWELNSLGLCR
jgi:hypothetical protein